jgi:hypothetical protein
VDARLYQLQGKAEQLTDLLPTLQEFYREKLAALLSHQAAARLIAQYDFNNTYQYIVNREETQLSWLGTAIVGMGGTVDRQDEPVRQAPAKGTARMHALFEEDARSAQAFVDRWRPRVDAMANARHRGMLRVILGETLEQKRFFEQARAGDMNLLGRRGSEAGERVGEVLSTRWIE